LAFCGERILFFLHFIQSDDLECQDKHLCGQSNSEKHELHYLH